MTGEKDVMSEHSYRRNISSRAVDMRCGRSE